MPDERVNPQLRRAKQAKGRRHAAEAGGDFGRTVMGSLLGFHVGFWDYVTFVASPPQWKRIAFVFLLSGVLGGLPARGHTAGLDCPEMGPGAVPNLIADAQVKLVTSGNSVDVANEIYDLISKLQIEKPNMSYAELTDTLVAAYCPVVANMANLTASEKWRRMRQFDTIMRQQLTANMIPPGSLIIANVPLPPPVYRELRSQAASVGQTPAQLMTAILSRATGK
jgi:hypothetical protein